ncbi:MAG: hypothetical protein GY861_22225 [bacterium]|nr:hypothetical protein [bacterium]
MATSNTNFLKDDGENGYIVTSEDPNITHVEFSVEAYKLVTTYTTLSHIMTMLVSLQDQYISQDAFEQIHMMISKWLDRTSKEINYSIKRT